VSLTCCPLSAANKGRPNTSAVQHCFGKMHSPQFSPALQIRFTAGLCQCSYTSGDLLFIQLCSDPTPVRCNTVFGHFCRPLCDSDYTYGGLLFIQVCIKPTPMQCSFGQGKTQPSLFSAAPQNRLTAGPCVTLISPMEICSSYRCAVNEHCYCSDAAQAGALTILTDLSTLHLTHCSVRKCVNAST